MGRAVFFFFVFGGEGGGFFCRFFVGFCWFLVGFWLVRLLGKDEELHLRVVDVWPKQWKAGGFQ